MCLGSIVKISARSNG